MKATITKEGGFTCSPNGATEEHFPMGATVEGQVAEWAIDLKVGKKLTEKKQSAPENKAKTAAPESKDGADDDLMD